MGSKSEQTVDGVFQDFQARRDGLIKALTTDVEEFHQKCDPQKENLCLYGLPNGSWVVEFPIQEIPAEIPEPALGINFSRDGMSRNAWLCHVAIHCDCWLKSLAFYFAGQFKFDKNDRERLFQLINDMPTIYELVNTKGKGQSSSTSTKGKRAKNAKPSKAKQPKVSKRLKEKVKEDEDDEKLGSTICAHCGVTDAESDYEFWIGCDSCEMWFHGKCVNISPARAEKIKEYVCPICSNEQRA